MGETAETAETAEPCETVDLAPAAVLVRHGRICTTLGHYRTNFVQQNPLGFGYVPKALCDLLSCFGSSFVSLFW